jgi:hypothetical protein
MSLKKMVGAKGFEPSTMNSSMMAVVTNPISVLKYLNRLTNIHRSTRIRHQCRALSRPTFSGPRDNHLASAMRGKLDQNKFLAEPP